MNFYNYVEKYFLLLESIDDAMILVDVNKKTVIEYNKSAISLFGLIDAHEKIYHYQFYAKNEIEKYLEYYKKSLAKSGAKSEKFHIRVNNISVPVKVKISTSYINGLKMALVIFTDLRGQYQLEKRRKLLATAMDQVAESVVITNSYGDIEYVNLAYEQINGYSFDEVSGEQLNILKGDDTNTYHHKLMWDEISNGRVWRGN